MTLTDAFTTFLGHRQGRDELVSALQRAGHGLEAELLMDWTDGLVQTETGDGRRAWVGPTLPPEPQPGDLWLDIAESMPMLYLPRTDIPDPLGWLALRPVERWQFAGFLAVAKLKGGGKVGDHRAFDRRRLLDGPETEPVTRVLRGEASLYAQWFAKLVPDRTDWQLAAESIDPATLWGTVTGEWGGEEWDGVYSVTDLETLHLEDEPPDELLFRTWEAPEDVGFRTIVGFDTGLFTDTAPADAIGARLEDQARR